MSAAPTTTFDVRDVRDLRTRYLAAHLGYGSSTGSTAWIAPLG